jgi:hypothetical protein
MTSYATYRRWILRATAYFAAAMVAGIAVAAQPRRASGVRTEPAGQ